MLTSSFGGVIRQAREVRGLSAVETAARASISAGLPEQARSGRGQASVAAGPAPAERGTRHRLCGPDAARAAISCPATGTISATTSVGAALFSDITDDERDELAQYLAWFRARRRMKG